MEKRLTRLVDLDKCAYGSFTEYSWVLLKLYILYHGDHILLSQVSYGVSILAVAKQLYEWFSPSVCPSICHLFDNVAVIVSWWNFRVITIDQSDEFTGGFKMMLKAWHSIVKVPFWFWSFIKFQNHTGQKITNFDPDWSFLDCNSSLKTLDSLMALKWCTKFDLV